MLESSGHSSLAAPPYSSRTRKHVPFPAYNDPMQDLAQTTAPTRICRGPCCRELPLTSFRRSRKGSDKREHDCDDCHKLALRERNRRRREKVVERYARSGYYQRLDRRLRRLTCTMLSRLGGVEEVAKLWVKMIRRAEHDRPGCPFLLASYMSLLRLIEFSEALTTKEAAEGRSPAEMTDTELAEVIHRRVLEILRGRPELALWAAAELGWEVVPPPDSGAAPTG